MVGKWIEVDSIRHRFGVAQAVGVGSRKLLLDHLDRLIQEITRRNRLGYFLSVRRLMRVLRGVHDRLEERLERVGIFLRELFGRRKGAARMTGPDLFTQHEDEPGLF